MAMESVKLYEGNAVPSSGESNPTDDVPLNLGTNGVQENEHVGDLLNDFDTYFQDINDCLTVSRVVSDAVFKGIVSAVTKEAAEKVTEMELQVTGLKERIVEGQMVQKLQEELEVIVIRNAFHNLDEECEKRLLGSQFYGNKVIRCRDKLMQASGICKDLEAVQKSLTNLEHLSTHGSLESDYFHRRVSNHNGSLREGNGSNEESNVNLPENFESSCLKLLSAHDLYSQFRDMIMKIKRDHETTVQTMTDNYFSLKREFLNHRGSFLPHKSKDFDVLRKRIPDVISKLNDIVLVNEDFSEMCDLSSAQYNSLVMENRHLRDMLNDKEREVKCLSSQVSEDEEKLTQKSSGEVYLSKQIEDLKTSLDDAQMEASLNEEGYKCIIRDLAHQTECEEQENNVKSIMMQDTLELIYKEALYSTEAKMSSECGDFSNMQTITAQEISGVVYQEVLKDMEIQLNNLKEKYLEQDKLIVSLQSKASDMEKMLSLKDEEKHNLEQKILELETLVEDKAKLLIKEKEKFDKEISKVMDHKEQQYLAYVHQVDLSKDQVRQLTETLQKVELESRTAILQEREKASSLIAVKDREYKEQIKSFVHFVQELAKTFADFELRAALSIKSNKMRLDDSTIQLKSLIVEVKLLRQTGLKYKEKLDRRCSDLKKAEDEVDLLADEVDVLLGLLEKIYIALDHYSPILQHYPGIMEILKLVQKELNGEFTKSGSRTP